MCLERQNQRQAQPQPSPGTPSNTTTLRPGSSTSSHSPFFLHTMARKRIIYAHADILRYRSEYFSNMFSSAFAECVHGLPAEKKTYTVICEEADFETMYWLLKWIYANWLLFKDEDDPRDAVDGVGTGWSANWLNSRGGEWDWKTFRRSESEDGSVVRDDAHSVTSVESLRSKEGSVTSSKRSYLLLFLKALFLSPHPGGRNPGSPTKGPSTPTNIPRPASGTGARRSTASSISGASTSGVDDPTSSSSRTKSAPVALSLGNTNYGSPIHYQLSPRSQRQHQPTIVVTPDPHPHPTPAPPPASALRMYQVAHRYGLSGLCSLALEHMTSTLTPQSSLPLLLAVSTWDTLRSLIEVCHIVQHPPSWF